MENFDLGSRSTVDRTEDSGSLWILDQWSSQWTLNVGSDSDWKEYHSCHCVRDASCNRLALRIHYTRPHHILSAIPRALGTGQAIL